MFMKKCAVAVTLALTLTVFACLVPFSWWTARAAAAPKASAVNESADFRGKGVHSQNMAVSTGLAR